MEPKKIPLHQRIKRNKHIRIARLQDLVVEALYRVFPDCVIHGGTAIWRCYEGSRFSEDIDIYIDRDIEKIEVLFKQLEGIGFELKKKRVKENFLYSKLFMDGEEISLEAVFKKVPGEIKEYETYEGMLINVYTMLSEDLLLEKISAYKSRRKIRDLYDIFFLLRHVKEPEKVADELKEFLNTFERPMDGEDLKVLILVGVAPTTRDMVNYIKRWVA